MGSYTHYRTSYWHVRVLHDEPLLCHHSWKRTITFLYSLDTTINYQLTRCDPIMAIFKNMEVYQ
jgi:hypothetical protein